jgi:hypothetical protein
MNPIFKQAINNNIAILITKGNLKRRVFEGTLKEVGENYIVLDINSINTENRMPNYRTFGDDTFVLATELDIKLYYLIKDIL